MTERPIIFCATMVRAIMEGRKTQTRRIAKLPSWFGGCPPARLFDGKLQRFGCLSGSYDIAVPYWPGDRLWVRETWASFGSSRTISPAVPLACQIRYDADNTCQWHDVPEGAKGVYDDASFRLRPSIHMPRWASRITLEVEAVRVERVRDISEADAKAEGIVTQAYGFGVAGLNMTLSTAREAFGCLWDSINAKDGR